MNVLQLSPGFPDDMPLFTEGLARIGARVFGIGDQPTQALPDRARRSLTDYLQVSSLWDAERVVKELHPWLRGKSIDRIECLWEPGMEIAARLREVFSIPGMNVAETIPFRDKVRMKEILDSAGLRTPKHARAVTKSQCWQAAEQIGFPLVIKPIAGAGSADTHVIRTAAELDPVLQRLGHVQEVSVEEYIEGEEFTFDAICAGGKVLFHNIAWYQPKPLFMVQHEWISPRATCVRDTDMEEVKPGKELGLRVLEALRFRDGFAHMEWFRTASGEAIFGEIGARAPGGRLTHAMNYSIDGDLFTGWAEAVCAGSLSQSTEKKYNTSIIFKRAQGQGTIRRIAGLETLRRRFGESIVHIDLVPIGSPRRDFRKVITGDGWLVVRHPELRGVLEIAHHVAADLQIYAD